MPTNKQCIFGNLSLHLFSSPFSKHTTKFIRINDMQACPIIFQSNQVSE